MRSGVSSRGPKLLLGLSILCVALGGAGLASAQEQPPTARLTGRAIAEALRSGGYVVYFRHATSNQDQADTDDPRLKRCEGQRNLSEDGRRMARDFGVAFKALGVPVGRVITSPYCRTVDTAKLAFGRHEDSDALFFAAGVDKQGRAAQRVELLRMLSTLPTPGTNTILVSHHANLKEATGLWPKREGDAHVFQPKSGGTFEYVGEVTSEQWTRWAQETAGAPRPTPAPDRAPPTR
jgi:phosphohistidine phosphatase SixA